MFFLQKSFSFLFIMTLLTYTHPVFAGIVECGNDGNISNSCTICDLAAGANNITLKIMEWLSYAAVLAIVISGILYITSGGNQQTISMAKTAIKNTIIGVCVSLGAFLIIHFTLRALGGPSANSAVSNNGNSFSFQMTCPKDAQTNTGNTTNNGTSNSNTGTITQAEHTARQNLFQQTNGKVQLWGSDGKGNKTTKTLLNGLRPKTKEGIINFQKEFSKQYPNDVITITGGTEDGHSTKTNYSHKNGYKVDYDDSPNVTKFITENFKKVSTNRTDVSAAYSDNNGNIYYKESDHWDVCYQCA